MATREQLAQQVKGKIGQQSDDAIINQLKQMGFDDTVQEPRRRLIISSEGREKTGKSHFGLTGPAPIIYLNIDIGTEGVVEKFQNEGKRVLIYDVRVPKESSKEIWSSMWTDFKLRVRKLYSLKSGTVLWDTATEAYELARLAHFGRLTEVKPSDYSVVNNEWRDVLRTAYDSDMNTVFIHKTKAVWRMVANSRGGSSLTKTNDFELSGFSEMGYMAQVNLVHLREDTDAGTVFSVCVKDCRNNPGIAGTVMRGIPLPSGEKRTFDPLCNFNLLLEMVYG